MNRGHRRVLATLWLTGLLLALVGLSVGLSWRLLVVFLILLAALAWGRKIWPTLQKLEPALLLILALGIVLAAFAQAPEGGFHGHHGQDAHATSVLERGVGFLLLIGTLGVCGGLLALRWKRPVGGIVDILVFAFCLLFPLAVLLFQLFVSHHFETFAVRVGVGTLAYQLLAAFSVYIVLSQFVLQETAFRRRLRPLWIGAFCLLALFGAFRMLALGKSLLELRQREFEPGPLWQRAWERASRLDARLAREALASRAARHWLERESAETAFAVLDQATRHWPQGIRQRRRLERAAGSSVLATLLLGAGPVQEAEIRMAAMALDTRRGRLFFADEQGRLYLRAKKSLEAIGQVTFPPDESASSAGHSDAQVPGTSSGPVRDLLWWEQEQRLLLLFGSGSLAVLEIGPGEKGLEESLGLRSVEWLHQPRDVSARALAVVPTAGCVVIGYGDLEIRPVLGSLDTEVGALLAAPASENLRGQDVLRGLCFIASGRSGYRVDAFGDLHPFGETPLREEALGAHCVQQNHHRPRRDQALAVDCLEDGFAVCVFDAYGRIHCIEKEPASGKVRSFGSTRDYFDRPVVVDVVPAYDSYYLLHTDGRVDRRTGLKRTVALLRPGPAEWLPSFPPLLVILGLGWVLLRSPRRVPCEGERCSRGE